MKNLNKLTEKEYKSLDKAGMLYVLYPEATGDYNKDKDTNEVPYTLHIKQGEWLRVGDEISRCEEGMLITYPRALNCSKATPLEIEAHLIEEAKKRGLLSACVKLIDIQGCEIMWARDCNMFSYTPLTDSLTAHSSIIYKQGKWAEIVKEQPIKIGGHEVKFEKGQIKVGCKTIPNEFTETLINFINEFQELNLHSIEINSMGDIEVEERGGICTKLSKDKFIEIRSKMFYR